MTASSRYNLRGGRSGRQRASAAMPRLKNQKTVRRIFRENLRGEATYFTSISEICQAIQSIDTSFVFKDLAFGALFAKFSKIYYLATQNPLPICNLLKGKILSES
jgi:hypothetical protein